MGKLGADEIVGVYSAKRVTEFWSDSFPPQVNVREDGTAAPLKAEVYLAKTRKAHDIFVFTADAQPATSEGEYKLAEEVIEFAKKSGVKTVYTLAAYITGSFSKSQKVYGAGTSLSLLELVSKKGVILMKDGGITGMNGLIIGIAALNGMEGACLLGETSGYVIDAAASKAVLEALSRIIGFTIDTAKLNEKVEETQKLISQLQSMAEQSRESAVPPRADTKPGYIS